MKLTTNQIRLITFLTVILFMFIGYVIGFSIGFEIGYQTFGNDLKVGICQ